MYFLLVAMLAVGTSESTSDKKDGSHYDEAIKCLVSVATIEAIEKDITKSDNTKNTSIWESTLKGYMAIARFEGYRIGKNVDQVEEDTSRKIEENSAMTSNFFEKRDKRVVKVLLEDAQHCWDMLNLSAR